MDIGIITYHYSYNFGAMIQAYALRMAIKELVGEDVGVDIINYIPPTFTNKAESLSDDRYEHQKLDRKRFLSERCGIRGEATTDISAIREYDIYITGSDQVWNPNLPVFEESSEYFLSFVKNGKIRASYAASVGEKITDDFSTELFEKYIPLFDYLSVREQSYCGFIEKFTDKKCYAVLDPTFLLRPSHYIGLMPRKEKKAKYTLCVSYAMKAKRKLYDLANRYTILHKQNIVNMEQQIKPYFFMNPEESIFYSSIEEILWYIDNAEMIITDSFHFVVFSIIFHKPFYVMLTGKTSRIVDLLQYLGLEDRILPDMFAVSKMNNKIDYDEVDRKIAEKKEISIDYLKEVIGLNG